METRKKKEKALIFDVDDTISLFIQEVISIHNKLYGTCITESEISTWSFEGVDFTDMRGNRVTGEQLIATYKMFEDHGLYATLRPRPYVKFALDTIHQLKYKIILLTARDEKYKLATELNLLMNDLKYDRLIFGWDKASIINSLKREYKVLSFCDDRYSTTKAVAELCDLDNVYLINMPANMSEDTESFGIKRITDIIDVVKELKRIK